MRLFVLLLLALTSPVAAAPRFDALAFFTGRTEGSGAMKIMFGRHRAVHVHGNGRIERDGTLVLDQTVERDGKPATQRTWRIRRDGSDGYGGTLSDARGPITGETVGDRLHLRYRAPGGVRVEQWLTLAPDGRSARNRLTARKLGVVVARLDETIRKLD